jgi:hypothetical protein
MFIIFTGHLEVLQFIAHLLELSVAASGNMLKGELLFKYSAFIILIDPLFIREENLIDNILIYFSGSN